MKKHHATIVLAVIFLTGLIVLWWAPPTGVDPDASGAILPALSTIPVADIRRLEVVRPSPEKGEKEGKGEKEKGQGPATRIVVERRDQGTWQILEPFDAAADPTLVETMARNLKDMGKSPDAGTIHDDPATFGLARPSATIRVFGSDSKTPLATLEV